jgi:hypothetical protein
MGTPVYPADLAEEVRSLNAKIKELYASTFLVNRDGRPWTPSIISSVSGWPSTTSTSFTSLQYVSSFKSHAKMYMTLNISAPAAGCSIQVVSSDLLTVLYGPTVLSSGVQTLSFNFYVPPGVDSYEEFTVVLQAKSTTAGQTTSAAVLNSYCRT